MNIYYMNESTEWEPIVVHNDKPSEYQDLVDAYTAKGGKITVCPPGKASGALDLGKYQPSMDPKKPSGPDGWDSYFDMNHVPFSDTEGVMDAKLKRFFGASQSVNNIKRVTK